MYYPDKAEFNKLAKKGNLVPVYKEIVADMETPVSAFKKIEGECSFLLESVEGGENLARYSFLGTCKKSQLRTPQSFAEIRDELKKYQPVKVAGLPRFHGGLVGFVSYDSIREIERIPDKNRDDLGLPRKLFLLTDTILAFDHVKHKIVIISNAEIGNNPSAAYQEACHKIDQLEKMLRKPLGLTTEDFALPTKPRHKLKYKSNLSPKDYERMVNRAKEYIKAGDIIQTVLSQRFEMETGVDPFRVYRILRTVNPSPYMYYLKLGKIKLVGSSPEVMVRLENNVATVRPIAGTRTRGRNKNEDEALEKELLASDKERAEHIMLVDLGRNDLGRVCDYNSIKVTDQMTVERYSHVMHIVSNVSGNLTKGKDAVDLLEATFPAGTVSGAPKVRAMEIIDELENIRRGPYAGCVGYFGFSGELDSCITIRTILFNGHKAYIQAGAGIVADSNPKAEYQETVNKASALLKAIELAL
jgi:anthranilate synthase component 1